MLPTCEICGPMILSAGTSFSAGPSHLCPTHTCCGRGAHGGPLRTDMQGATGVYVSQAQLRRFSCTMSWEKGGAWGPTTYRYARGNRCERFSGTNKAIFVHNELGKGGRMGAYYVQTCKGQQVCTFLRHN